jgi:hypothetical protein
MTWQMFIILVLVLLVPMIVTIIQQEPNSIWLDGMYGSIPHIAEMQIIRGGLVDVIILKNLLSQEWTLKSESTDGTSWLPYFVMQNVDILIYAGLLFGSNSRPQVLRAGNSETPAHR